MLEIRGAHHRIDDGEDNQNDCDDCKRSKSFASRYVPRGPYGVLIHSDELEEEVGQSSKVKELSRACQQTPPSTLDTWNAYNGGNHA